MAKEHTIESYYNFDYIDLGYTEEQLLREWQLIQYKNHDYSSINVHNKLIKQFQFKEFYKAEIAMWKQNNLHNGLPLRSWLYMNRKKYIHKDYVELTQEEIMRGFKIAGILVGNSFHSPFYIKKFCLEHNITSVYDPCGGWGHRMLGAIAAGCSYHYNDINTVATNNCRMLATYLNIENKVTFSSCDSSTYKPTCNYDAVFTCPPYHNVEHYTDLGAENLSYKDFLDWWKATVTISMSNFQCSYFAFIINDCYEQDMTNIIKSIGFKQLEKHTLGFKKSHLTQNKRSHENLIIFGR